MPLPTPSKGESQDKFIGRCMSALKGEFPDQKQRTAVCFSQWKKKDKKASYMENVERRAAPQSELRVVDEGSGTAAISGYAALYGVLSEDLGGFREKIKRGAFTRTLNDKADVRALVDHQTGLMTLARTANSTLELTEDKKGLHVRFTPPDTNAGRDVAELIRSGTLSQMSFAFRVAKKGDSWAENDDGEVIRTVKDLDLFDVSIVTYPAYAQTSVALRSMDIWREKNSRSIDRQREINQRAIDSRSSDA